MGMITGLWKGIKLVCGNHTVDNDSEYPELIIQSGPYSMFYACPKGDEINREFGELPCYNRINLIDYEKMLEHISSMIIDAEQNDESVCLKNHKWKDKSRFYEIISHKNDIIVVKMVDTLAIKGHKVK